jgi:hypothetical protein
MRTASAFWWHHRFDLPQNDMNKEKEARSLFHSGVLVQTKRKDNERPNYNRKAKATDDGLLRLALRNAFVNGREWRVILPISWQQGIVPVAARQISVETLAWTFCPKEWCMRWRGSWNHAYRQPTVLKQPGAAFPSHPANGRQRWRRNHNDQPPRYAGPTRLESGPHTVCKVRFLELIKSGE